MSIGAAIREARKARGWTQSELATRVRAAWETVSRWETGDIIPAPRAVLALESVLGCTLEVKDESEPTPRKRRK